MTSLASLLTKSDANGASCYDNRLSSFINSALSYYAHDMAQLSNYILQSVCHPSPSKQCEIDRDGVQIQKAGYPGYWLVHAQNIRGHPQGPEWQSVTNGDLFKPRSTHGCYYHDTQTYIIITRYY